MKSKQQDETLEYFKENATQWHEKALGLLKNMVDTVKQRNDYVLHVIDRRGNTRTALDVGCGSGELVRDMAMRSIDAVGVDFAEEMIKIAKDRAAEKSLHLAKFECCSIFNFNFGNNKYDVISGNGFIEYISPEEFNSFLEIAFDKMNQGGSLVLGSRNRLFNIFSANEFTKNEIDKGATDALLKEAIALTSGSSISDLVNMETAPLSNSGTEHIYTDVKVSTRYQFTPVQLMKLLKSKGFEPVNVSPIHVHGVAPSFKSEHPEVHCKISNLLQPFAIDNAKFLPSASSFMIHARKI
ncbi:MAG: class I SAM-dependent methyltransferase [Parcubacteria group bacterium]|nr:class I SAM-dependent methyltransferase [Parcubacteria group bacterium]